VSSSWQQLSFALKATELEAAETLLRLADAQAISLLDSEDRPLLEPAPGTTPLWPAITVRALFPAQASLDPLARILRQRIASCEALTIARIDDAQWQAAMSSGPKGQTIGTRLALAGRDAAPVPGRALVRLNFGVAFGTGEHATTAMCLSWLDRGLASGACVLDYGCGSGILALAALALGAQRAWAVDIEPQALAATHANAELNDCLQRLWIGEPAALPDIQADVILANILAGALCELAPTFASHLGPGGHLVVSGLLETQQAQVHAALAPYFGEFAAEPRDAWICLSAIRNGAAVRDV
jgi:ribosomal protein L11 methyltransferase